MKNIAVSILRDETKTALRIALGREPTDNEHTAFIDDLQFASTAFVMSQAMIRALSIKAKERRESEGIQT